MDNGAVVTVTNVTTGRYKASVTLPTLSAEALAEINVVATVNGVTDNSIVWRERDDLGLAGAALTALGDARLSYLDQFVSKCVTRLSDIQTQVYTASGSATFDCTGKTVTAIRVWGSGGGADNDGATTVGSGGGGGFASGRPANAPATLTITLHGPGAAQTSTSGVATTVTWDGGNTSILANAGQCGYPHQAGAGGTGFASGNVVQVVTHTGGSGLQTGWLAEGGGGGGGAGSQQDGGNGDSGGNGGAGGTPDGGAGGGGGGGNGLPPGGGGGGDNAVPGAGGKDRVEIDYYLDAPTNADVTLLKDLLQADKVVDKAVTPWALVWIKKGTGALGTGTELLRQKIYDVDGNPLTSTATIPGREVS